MGKKCCKRRPPCKDCPKLGKKKKKVNAIPQGDFLRGAVTAFFCPILKLFPDEKRQTLR